MGWMDIAAAITAMRTADGPCVTVSVDKIEFKKPIRLGDIVTIEAHIASIGRTSLDISLHVFKDEKAIDVLSRKEELQKRLCLTGRMTFVAVNKKGKPRAVHP